MRPWRKMTWVLVVWCVLVVGAAVTVVILGVLTSNTYCTTQNGLVSCTTLSNGTIIAVVIAIDLLVFLVGFIGFLFFAAIWWMSSRHERGCPLCGERVDTGHIQCLGCGFDFEAAT